MTLHEGDKAPNFELLDQEGKKHRLRDYQGQWLLVYFYPKDDTPGCTKEACSIRDNLTAFNHLGLAVVGISTDSVASHKKFAEKYGLNFPILADTEKKTVNDYGVWQEKNMMGRKYMGTTRSSFLVDPSGNIAKIWPKVKPEDHAAEVMQYRQMLQ